MIVHEKRSKGYKDGYGMVRWYKRYSILKVVCCVRISVFGSGRCNRYILALCSNRHWVVMERSVAAS